MKIHFPDHAWFTEARYGLFIHWGAYSVAARGEWLANRELIPLEEYKAQYVDAFHAENYDPKQWARLAKEAGMGYAVLTTRHHDGFALWPTACSEFHAGRLGPKRDLVGPFVEAFREVGLKVGLYYSPADWFHPDYPGPHFRDWPRNEDWSSEEARLRFVAYYHAQLRELLTQYGKIDYLWYDGCIPNNLQGKEVNEDLLKLQPHLLINERNGSPSHVHVSEQSIRRPKEDVLWEACMTLNTSWGYHAGDHQWKNPNEVIRLLTETAAGAGNLLLNIGPRGDGSIPEESADILLKVGSWLAQNGDSIHNSTPCNISWNQWGRCTANNNKLYLHIWNEVDGDLCFAEIKNTVKSAKVLATGLPLSIEQDGPRCFIRGLPKMTGNDLTLTLELELDGPPELITEQTSFWIPG